jgi:hypothetical protein
MRRFGAAYALPDGALFGRSRARIRLSLGAILVRDIGATGSVGEIRLPGSVQ